MSGDNLYLGIDLGTSGARICVMNDSGETIATGKASLASCGDNHRNPAIWRAAVDKALQEALSSCDVKSIRSIAIDGTSGTMLPVDTNGSPLSDGLMYNDPCNDQTILDNISAVAPSTSAAHGANSALARAIGFQQKHQPAAVLHQADWIAHQFTGIFSSDDNNALKTGYDPVTGKWPDWIADTGMDVSLLPSVIEPGSITAQITKDASEKYGFSKDTLIVAGTTDGCASFLATGAVNPGEGVSALGTTLTIKILSDKPIFDPQSGIYSHQLLGMWLAGGASNTGGNVLMEYFSADEISELSLSIDPETNGGLDYYPLVQPGERFPISDPDLQPRITPRPEDDTDFLKALLEGIAGVEKLAYDKLEKLGAPALVNLRSVGGGANNDTWSKIRKRKLRVPMSPILSSEAAYGSAILAKQAIKPL